ncbi:AAA family ATPase [Nonomuraea sediminis]|uniref:AAA family ATPase n=1 Tax=Nonomuraea sediminis TaxID=2835864 RepID=UPI001BDD26A8|nr:AAA family ATPase [Nonomuraea sediminis]
MTSIYRGTGVPHDGIEKLPPPPPWRTFGEPAEAAAAPAELDPVDRRRAIAYRPSPQAVSMVNAALMLRRPLLVTGPPGSGKSTLAHHVAYELNLGPVLHWPVNRSTTLGDGLFQPDGFYETDELGLGPLGTALLPTARPRVLLIDDLDNGDVDLPNDLLHVIETGSFTISRSRAMERSYLHTSEGRQTVVSFGRVLCAAFPLMVITSNGEREFPARFRRRCLPLDITPPSTGELVSILQAHLGAVDGRLVEEFLDAGRDGGPAVDQLLNAVFLAAAWADQPVPEARQVIDTLMRRVEADDYL